MNLIDAFENGHALLPVKPDILVLPSDLKPFIKVRTVAFDLWTHSAVHVHFVYIICLVSKKLLNTVEILHHI